MYRIYFLSFILLFGWIIEAVHFRGGTITWKPLNNTITTGNPVSIMFTQTYSWTLSQIGCNNSMIDAQSPPIDLVGKAGTGANLICNDSCSTSGGYVGNEVPITGTCVDFSSALDLTVSQRSDIVNVTAGAHFTVTFYGSGGWQTLALGSSAGWSLSCFVDLRARSDNGLINTPPVATCISYLSVPVNVQQTIQIPVLDADNDFLRCRFASGYSECLNACPPTSLPPGTTLSTSCALTITGTTAGDYYLVAIQVEDFVTNSSTTPMSSVPLQFLIYVYSTPTCTLKPLLITNLTNSCQGVQVGVNFTMTLVAINRCGNGQIIDDIATLSFPIVIKSPLVQSAFNTSIWSMKITWRPTASQVGSQVFCAVANNNASVQSDQYCLTFFVGLTSVPPCPGVTTTTTTTSSSTSTTTSSTSTKTSSTSTVTTSSSTTTITTSSSTTTTTAAATLRSSTSNPTNPINWPLILGLSLLALALALCCALCCWYYVFGRTKNRRRRKKTTKELDHDFERHQRNGKSYHQRLRSGSQTQEYVRRLNRSITITSDSHPLSCITTTRINQREKSLIDNQRELQSKRQYTHSTDAIQDDKLAQSAMFNEEEDPTHSVTFLQDSFVSKSTPSRSVNVIKVSRVRETSVDPIRSISRSGVTTPPKRILLHSSNTLEKSKTFQRSPSAVSVTRVRRSASVGEINRANQRTRTALSKQKFNQNTVINLK